VKLPHDWIAPDWPAPARVRSLITTRNGGASTGAYASFNLGRLTDDNRAAVDANHRQLDCLLPQPPRWLRQVHGSRVVIADELAEVAQADASIARRTATVCAIMVADCMPVLLCDRSASVVGVAHAGWRGLSSGVVENTVRAMQVDPSQLLAYLGPAIGPAAFEVGADVRDAFVAAAPAASAAFKPQRPGKWLADLFELGRQRLAACGVSAVFGGGLCTYGHPDRFFSHRREPASGRMAALIWLA